MFNQTKVHGEVTLQSLLEKMEETFSNKPYGKDDPLPTITLFTSSERFGVEVYSFTPETYIKMSHTNVGLFIYDLLIHSLHDSLVGYYKGSSRSLQDMGIIPNTYNGRKTFFTLYDAVNWIKQSEGKED